MVNQNSNPGQDNAKTYAMKPYKRIVWPKNTVMIAIKEITMVLQDCLVRVVLSPLILCSTL